MLMGAKTISGLDCLWRGLSFAKTLHAPNLTRTSRMSFISNELLLAAKHRDDLGRRISLLRGALRAQLRVAPKVFHDLMLTVPQRPESNAGNADGAKLSL